MELYLHTVLDGCDGDQLVIALLYLTLRLYRLRSTRQQLVWIHLPMESDALCLNRNTEGFNIKR